MTLQAISPLFGYRITFTRPAADAPEAMERGKYEGLLFDARRENPKASDAELQQSVEARLDEFERVLKECETARQDELAQLDADHEISFKYTREFGLGILGKGHFIMAEEVKNPHWAKQLKKAATIEAAHTLDADYAGYDQGISSLLERPRMPLTGALKAFKNRFSRQLPTQQPLAEWINSVFDAALTTVGRPPKTKS